MANPNQSRDQRGRFSRTGVTRGLSAKDLKEAARDRLGLDRAKLTAKVADQQARLDQELAVAARLKLNKPRRSDDPHEVVDWEQENIANRTRLRTIRARIKELRSSKP